MLQARTTTHRALLLLLCAFVLAAQLGGAWHAVDHAAHGLATSDHAVLSSAAHDAPGEPELLKLCAFDAAFGQVLGAGPTSTYPLSLQTSARESASETQGGFVVAYLLPPRSRGPPALL